MAAKDKKSTAKPSKTSTKVTRITAADDAKPKKVTKVKAEEAPAAPQAKKRRNPLRKLATPFIAIGRYFKGAWYELRQVRWPDRRATWGMTGALVGFTLFFVVVILLLDALFKYLFQLILG